MIFLGGEEESIILLHIGEGGMQFWTLDVCVCVQLSRQLPSNCLLAVNTIGSDLSITGKFESNNYEEPPKKKKNY